MSSPASPVKLISVIRHRGDPKTAETLTGHTVRRTDSIFMPENGTTTMCAPYDDHFIYDNNFKDAINQPSQMCTCGAAAVIVNPGTRSAMFVCYLHLTTGQHATGGTRWI